MRHSIAAGLAVLLVCGLSVASVADDSQTAVPKEWRVEVRTRVSVFEGRSHRVPSTTVELRSNGEVTETVDPFNKDPERTLKRTLNPQDTLTGLHIVWSALEDAPLMGGPVFDTDYAHILLETKNWTWKFYWFNGGASTKGVEERRDSFVKFVQQRKVDSRMFRTQHRTATELRARWMKESQTVGSVEWQGTAAAGDDSLTFASRRLGRPKVESEKNYGPLISIVADLRDRCVERETTGDKNVWFRLGKLDGHGTIINIKGLNDFSEFGPNVERLIEQAKE